MKCYLLVIRVIDHDAGLVIEDEDENLVQIKEIVGTR